VSDFHQCRPSALCVAEPFVALHGVSTSIRLENMFWNVLEEIGSRDDLTVNQLITKLYDELVEAGVDDANFASFLRVCCARYLSLQLAGRIPADRSVAIRSLDPAWVLADEKDLRTKAGDVFKRAPAAMHFK